jgi:4-aminobutyrate aminotransferase-like enzyme
MSYNHGEDRKTENDSNPLANYGAEVVDDMIVRSKGPYIYTKSGRKVLDFTSGQASHPMYEASLAHR